MIPLRGYPDLLSEEFDVKSPAARRFTYAMLGSPRCGSTLLCLWLVKAGFGVPWEYFNPRHVPRLVRRLGATTHDQYLEALINKRTSPDGVFGYKIFYDQRLYFDRAYPNLLDRLDTDHLLYIRRRDSIAQAISMAKALRSGDWASFGNEPVAAGGDIDLELIDKCHQLILSQHAGWEDWIQSRGVEPLRLFYEDIVLEPKQAMERIGAFLGIRPSPAALIKGPVPQTRVQADTSSAKWKEEYLRRYAVGDGCS